MTRLRSPALALLALVGQLGCTADFFVGPEPGGSSSGGEVDPTTTTAGASTAPPTTDAPEDDDGPSGGTTASPPASSSSTTSADSEGVSAGEATETEGESDPTGDPTTEGESDTTGEGDCKAADAEICEAAFPVCLWQEEVCSPNPCHTDEGEAVCLSEAPDCAWEGEVCLPTDCVFEAECSELEPGLCEETKGCVLVGKSCFSLECAPCDLVENVMLCNELPACTYNEKLKSCEF